VTLADKEGKKMNEETKNAEETQGNGRPWTPGPWGIEIVGGKWRLLPEGNVWRIGTFNCLPMRTPEETATHSLIAASPELFEALQGFVDEMPICCCHESWTKRGRVDPQCVRCNFKECIAEAEAALAKALGAQP